MVVRLLQQQHVRMTHNDIVHISCSTRRLRLANLISDLQIEIWSTYIVSGITCICGFQARSGYS